MPTLDDWKQRLDREGIVEFNLKVIPKASRAGIGAVQPDGSLRVKVTAPPERGKANEDVRELLAGVFGVAVRQVEILRGAASPHKRVRIVLKDYEP